MEKTNNTTTPKKVVKSKKARNRVLAIMLTAVVGVGGIYTYKKVNPNPTYKMNTTTMTNELDSTINYQNLNDYKLITIIDLNGNEKYFIGKKSILANISNEYKVVNLLNDQSYYIRDSKAEDEVYISEIEDLEDYLITLDYLKEEYNSEDLNNIYSEIVSYKTQNKKEKELTK